MFGLGAQEILLLLIIGGLPAVAVIIILLTRQARKCEPETDLPEDDFDQ